MKKNILIGAVLSCMMLLTGCQGGADKSGVEVPFAQGEWELTKIESREVIIEGENLVEQNGGKTIYSFEEDGVGTILIGDQAYVGEWSVEEEVTTFVFNDIVMEFTQEGETLVTNPDGILVVLERVVEEIEE